MSSKKIRILNIGLSSTLGGTEAFTMSLYKHVKDRGVVFSFLNTNSTRMMYEDYYQKEGLEVFKVDGSFKSLRSFLKNNISKFDYILVHINSIPKLYYLSFLHNKNVRTIAISHVANIDIARNFKGFIRRTIYSLRRFSYKYLFDIKLAVSDVAGKFVFGKKSKFKIIENYVDVSEYKFDMKDRRDIRSSLGIDESTITIGHVGRMAPVKNHLYLIDVFNEYHKMQPNSHLIMVGDGELLNIIKSKIHNLSLDKCTSTIVGENKPNKYYSSFDLFLFPSLHESYGRVVLEAQASGLSCFISDTIPSIVDKTKLVQFFDINNEPKIVANILMNASMNPLEKRNGYDDILDKNQKNDSFLQLLVK